MVDPHANGCPEPEVLAAYVDRGLSLTERARVDAHLASCPQCIALVAGVARTVAELSAHLPAVTVAPEATPMVTRHGVARALAAAAAVITIVAAPALVRPWLERDSRLVNLVASVGEHRSVLGRLTGGFPHAPLAGPSAGGQDGRAAGTDRVLLTAGKVRESFGERESPSQLHSRGLSQLLSGRYDEAALALLAASREQPANARYLSDVAAVQLERARLGLRPDDLPRALAAADRARRLDPSLHEAWFNRALALTSLSLRDHAKAAWTDYLDRDPKSKWAVEARSHLAELQEPSAADRWVAIEHKLQGPIDAALAEEAVRAQTTEARNFIDRELLPRWASAVASGENGSAELDRIRILADAFARVSGDHFYQDVVAAVDRADGKGAAARSAIASAHLDYSRAAAIYAEDRLAQALPGLTQARTAFQSAGSPFSERAALDIATAYYVSGRAADASALLTSVTMSAQQDRHTYHVGRSAWVQALIAFTQGQLGDAQTRYEEALSAFESMADAEQVAAVHGLLANLHDYLGDAVNGWRNRIESFPALTLSRSPRLQYQILLSAAGAIRRGDLETALVLQEAACDTAARWGSAGPIAEALSRKAEILFELGRGSESAAVLTQSRQVFAGVLEPAVRRRVDVAILSAESRTIRKLSPAAAVAAATRALKLLDQNRDRRRLPQLFLSLAKGNIVWGKLDEAETALASGIKAFEAERASLRDEGRLSTLDESWELFDTAVHLAVKKGDFERAFELAERGRSRTLAEGRQAHRSLAETQRSLRTGEAIVALNQFEDELAVWVITSTRAIARTRPMTRTVADQLVSRYQDEVRVSASRPLAGGELYNQIFRPFAEELKGTIRVVVVPDAPYQSVGFSGLWNGTTGRFVIENMDVATAPTVAYASANALPLPPSDVPPLILAAPQARSEAVAREFAAVYSRAEVLVGNAATKQRFMTDAPMRGVVHISSAAASNATYPLLSQLRLADEAGRPRSGQLFVRDIVTQRMPQTRLVVVDQAESTDRGEGPLSLARAFLSAGVRTVLGTLPGADEDASRRLILDFHRQLASGASAQEALSTIQRNAIQQNGRRLGAWTALALYGSDR